MSNHLPPLPRVLYYLFIYLSDYIYQYIYISIYLSTYISGLSRSRRTRRRDAATTGPPLCQEKVLYHLYLLFLYHLYLFIYSTCIITFTPNKAVLRHGPHLVNLSVICWGSASVLALPKECIQENRSIGKCEQ